VLLTLALAATWGLAAAIARRCGLFTMLNSTRARHWSAFSFFLNIALLSCVWVTAEWLRSRVLIEFPLMLLGHTQTPLLPLCQIADVGGASAVTFLVVGINACIAMLLQRPHRRRARRIAAAAWAGIVIVAIVYGRSRMSETGAPGPRVMVVQSVNKYSRGGAASLDQQAQFRALYASTASALAAGRGTPDANVDLVVWPEAVAPPLNAQARAELASSPAGPWVQQVHHELSELARQNRTAILAGGFYVGEWKLIDGKRTGTDIRNTAFLYDAQGHPVTRYDKIHLVPFAEQIPFAGSMPRTARLLAFLSPSPMNYTLTPGPPQRSLPLEGTASLRFAAAICFEDAMPERISSMVIPKRREAKDADFIVSLSNDGWFNAAFMAQRFDAAVFRAIENRLPMARSENGGVSGFVDSAGRRSGTIAAWTSGASVEQLQLDGRRTIYQIAGDWFATACTIITAMMLLRALWRGRGGREASPRRG
jgi:apolipoprotein N-acyltransferase